MKQRNWSDRLALAADLDTEPLPGQPLVELLGDGRAVVENHKGVTEYGPERICVRVRYGSLCICGCGLELARMTTEQLVITGRIDGISVIRRC